MNKVYEKEDYYIYQVNHEYIIHNTKKEFPEGHTHVRNLKTAQYLIDLCIHKSIPHHIYKYFIISLSRITTDEQYKNKLLELLGNKKCKQTYINRRY